MKIENSLREKSKISKWFVIIVAVSVLVRIVLQMLLPIWARGNFLVDDFLMVQYADSMAKTGWLGAYNMYTLNKVPGYSLFLHLNDMLGLPYMVSIGAFYSLASVVFLHVIRKLIKNEKLSLFCFWFVLFSPILFDANVAQKLYRQAIIPSLVLIIVSAYIAIYYERNNGFKRILPWSILAAICYGFFYIVREDSTWFSCFVLGATVLLVGLFIIENRKNFAIKRFLLFILCIIIPISSTGISESILSSVNKKHYGLYAKTDYNETYFAKVCKLLMSIEPEEEIQYIYISKDTIARAFEVSPTFSEIKDAFYARYDDPTTSGLSNGEFIKAMFCWNLRWAAGDAGIYENPLEMNEFFKTVYEELSAGFENGEFEKRNALIISPYARPIREGDFVNILRYSLKGYRDVITYTDLQAVYEEPSGPELNLEIMEDVTNQKITAYISDEKFVLSGWLFSSDKDEKLTIKLYDSNGNTYYPTFVKSSDVYQYFLASGYDYENAQNARFNFAVSEKSMCIDDLYISIFSDSKVYYDGSVSDFSAIGNDNIKMGIDKKIIYQSNDNIVKMQKTCTLFNKLIRVYQITSWLIAILAMIIYIAEFVVNIINAKKKRKTTFSFWFIKTGMLLTIWVNLVVVSINYFETDPNQFRLYYVAGVYPIWQIFIALSLCSLFYFVKPYIPVFCERLKKK